MKDENIEQGQNFWYYSPLHVDAVNVTVVRTYGGLVCEVAIPGLDKPETVRTKRLFVSRQDCLDVEILRLEKSAKKQLAAIHELHQERQHTLKLLGVLTFKKEKA